jgi:hypothetical protein
MGEQIDSAAEKKLIEDYLKLFCIEECLDEAVNAVIRERPPNPYKSLASSIESKTMPEILDVSFSMTLVGRSSWGVLVTVFTNIDSFSATACYSADEMPFPIIKDFSLLQDKVKASLVGMDPCKLSDIDRKAQSIESIRSPETLALSMAICRAGARHRGLTCYEYICELCGSSAEDMTIPMPVVALQSKVVEGNAFSQDILAFPVGAQSLEIALQKTLAALMHTRQLEHVTPGNALSASACPIFASESVVGVVKVLLYFTYLVDQ